MFSKTFGSRSRLPKADALSYSILLRPTSFAFDVIATGGVSTNYCAPHGGRVDGVLSDCVASIAVKIILFFNTLRWI